MNGRNSIEDAAIILDAINQLINSGVRKLQFNTSKQAFVLAVNEDGTADIKMNNETYDNVRIRQGLTVQANNIVWITVPNNDLRHMFVDDVIK
jgi:hypothetical protein